MNLKICIIISSISIGITVVNLIVLLINKKKTISLKKQYEKALAKFNSHENVKDEFQNIYDRINKVENISADCVDCVDKLEEKTLSNVQKIGLVKYNAYDETENKLSFALALLDGKDNGVLLNHIYSKHGSSIYSKLVENGEIKDRTSEEEKEALRIAIQDKDFKLRQEVTVDKKHNKLKKINKKA